jgi:uncharacterized protein (TIGR01777 family)
MKIVIPGGSGHLGTLLARAFHAQEHEVIVLSRRPAPAPWRTVGWDPPADGAWMRELDGAGVVINLAGRSVNCRYNPTHRREILQSRLASVRAVGAAIARARRPPATWLQASTATIYSHRFDADNDEATGPLGGDEPGLPDAWRFSVTVARAWEQALDEAPTPVTRKVKLRAAMVMSPDPGSAFAVLLGLVRRGVGGRAGDGRQYVSWIHERDLVRAIEWLIARPHLAGPVNLCAPHPLPNEHFMALLRAAAGVRFGVPAAGWMLELGALVLRTETELILKSRRVVPGRLVRDGFSFRHPTWADAAAELCRRADPSCRPVVAGCRRT